MNEFVILATLTNYIVHPKFRCASRFTRPLFGALSRPRGREAGAISGVLGGSSGGGRSSVSSPRFYDAASRFIGGVSRLSGASLADFFSSRGAGFSRVGAAGSFPRPLALHDSSSREGGDSGSSNPDTPSSSSSSSSSFSNSQNDAGSATRNNNAGIGGSDESGALVVTNDDEKRARFLLQNDDGAAFVDEQFEAWRANANADTAAAAAAATPPTMTPPTTTTTMTTTTTPRQERITETFPRGYRPPFH